MRKGNFKNLIARHRWLKGVPNSLTLCNSLCGFAAILYSLNIYTSPRSAPEVLAISAWIILFAMVFDALDGFAARIFNAASMHGLQMDSLADMVTFGVAPAVIAVVMSHSIRDMTAFQNIMIIAFSGVYLGCAALRLATYNVHAILEKKSGDKFNGLPSPGAAAAVCSMVIFYGRHFEGLESFRQLAFLLPVYAAVLGVLMVSNVPYQHIGKWLQSVRRNRRRMALLIIILAIIAVFRTSGIVVLVNLYIFSGPVVSILVRLKLLPHSFAPRLE